MRGNQAYGQCYTDHHDKISRLVIKHMAKPSSTNNQRVSTSNWRDPHRTGGAPPPDPMGTNRKDKAGKKMHTCPSMTAMAGSESQSVGRVLSSPWLPSTVQAHYRLLMSEIRFSMAAVRDLAGWSWASADVRSGVDAGEER
jgi:hypothetical protein